MANTFSLLLQCTPWVTCIIVVGDTTHTFVSQDSCVALCVAVCSTCRIQCTFCVKCITYVGDVTHPFVSHDSCTWIHCVYITCTNMCIHTYIWCTLVVHRCERERACVSAFTPLRLSYGVASISRLLKIIGPFGKRALYKWRYSAKETYDFKEPTNHSHPIVHILRHRMKRHELRVCACIHIHMYVMFLCIHVYVYMCKNIHIYIYIYTKVFISRKETVCIFTIWWFFKKFSVLPSAISSACVYIHVHTQICINIWMHTCTCTWKYKYTCIYIKISTYFERVTRLNTYSLSSVIVQTQLHPKKRYQSHVCAHAHIHKCVCMHAWMYVFTHKWNYMCTCIYIYTNTYIRSKRVYKYLPARLGLSKHSSTVWSGTSSACEHVHLHAYACMHVCMYTCTYTNVCMHVCIYTCTYINDWTCTCIYMHIHTDMNAPRKRVYTYIPTSMIVYGIWSYLYICTLQSRMIQTSYSFSRSWWRRATSSTCVRACVCVYVKVWIYI